MMFPVYFRGWRFKIYQCLRKIHWSVSGSPPYLFFLFFISHLVAPRALGRLWGYNLTLQMLSIQFAKAFCQKVTGNLITRLDSLTQLSTSRVWASIFPIPGGTLCLAEPLSPQIHLCVKLAHFNHCLWSRS